MTQNHEKHNFKAAQKITFFLTFFVYKPSQNRAPVWEWWRFEEKVLNMPINVQFISEHVFYWEIKFLQHSLRRVTNRKLSFLQLKLRVFMFYPKIADQQISQKNTSKIAEK